MPQVYHQEECIYHDLPLKFGEDGCICFDFEEPKTSEDAKQNHPSMQEPEPESESFSSSDYKKAAEAFRSLAKEYMRAFLILEDAAQNGAQMCLDLAEALDQLDNQQESNTND